MRVLLSLLAIITSSSTHTLHRNEDYFAKREQILQAELLLTTGGDTTLNQKESKVNECLMKYKSQEINEAFHNQQFNLSHHFFTYKDYIKDSKVYQIIKDMPKGAALHFHDMAIMNPDYLLNLTYMDHLYVCYQKEKSLLFRFSDKVPNKSDCHDTWILLKDARAKSNNVKELDAMIKKRFSLVCKHPDEEYPTIKQSWSAFMNYFGTVVGLLSYRPVWEQYFYDALKKFQQRNLIYVEVRSILPNLYDLDGTTYDQLITAKVYRKSIHRFKKDHPDFIGAKLIFAPNRSVNKETLAEYLQLASQLKADVPDIFAGFDLVGQEDTGTPLIDFAPQLLEASKDLDYFFHAGETDWYGTTADENLVDAILLGAKRIGHAYALPKHPLLMEQVIKKDIGIEVNVISNGVLSLVRDVRNHPLNIFLSRGMPVVLSSDDPGVWEAEPISDDFYVAFIGVASKRSDLRMLKTLALNSLKYSALINTYKKAAINKFNEQWNSFVDNFDCYKYQ